MVNRKDFRPYDSKSVSTKTYTPKGSNSDVAQAFAKGKSAKSGSMYSTGNKLYSYGTVIATRQSDGSVVLNNTKYSVTTSKQQSLAKRELQNSGVKVSGVTGGKDRGYEGEDFVYQDYVKPEEQKRFSNRGNIDDVNNPDYKKEVQAEKKNNSNFSDEEKESLKRFANRDENKYNADYEKMSTKEKLLEDKKHSLKIVEKKNTPKKPFNEREVLNKRFKTESDAKKYAETHDGNYELVVSSKSIKQKNGTYNSSDKPQDQSYSLIPTSKKNTPNTKIEMGDYKTSPSGFVTNVDGKRVVYVNNVKYEKHANAKVYINSNGDALHYTDIQKQNNTPKDVTTKYLTHGRTFNGEKYDLYSTRPTKSDAKASSQVAKQKSGYKKSRIIKREEKYQVWVKN